MFNGITFSQCVSSVQFKSAQELTQVGNSIFLDSRVVRGMIIEDGELRPRSFELKRLRELLKKSSASRKESRPKSEVDEFCAASNKDSSLPVLASKGFAKFYSGISYPLILYC